jgi:hypothetical protein
LRSSRRTDQDKALKGLESGDDHARGRRRRKSFFAMLLQNTKEGYFSDPIYGGNKDMAAWKMIGFPGAHYDYKEWVSRHGERVPYPPVGFKGRPGWTEALRHDHDTQTGRCGAGGLRLDRRHHGPAALRRGPEVVALERGPWRDTPPISPPASPRTSCATCGAITCSRTSPTTR